MNVRTLILRSLRYYWRTNATIALGIAVAVAVITGSLLVGASVTGSLRDSALRRLGNIAWAITPPHYFHQSLGEEVAKALHFHDAHPYAAALILTDGTASNPATDAVAPRAQVVGFADDFPRLFPGQTLPDCGDDGAVVNAALAQDLALKAGDDLLVALDRAGAASASSLFAQWNRKETRRTLRVTVRAVLPNNGIGGFSLNSGTAIPRNIFLSRALLQTVLGKAGQANALVCQIWGDAGHSDSGLDTILSYRATGTFRQEQTGLLLSIQNNQRPGDYGLIVRPNVRQNCFYLQSDSVLLPQPAIAAAQTMAHSRKLRATSTSVYLAKTVESPTHGIAYALVAGMEHPPRAAFDFLAGGGKLPENNECWLNSWAAQDLHAHIGENIHLSYLVPNRDGTYETARLALHLSGIVNIAGPADDPGLAPQVDGITKAARISDWSTPFPIDNRLITPRDEAYWTRYGPTPKLFVSADTMKTMCAGKPAQPKSSPNWVTGVRIEAEKHTPATVPFFDIREAVLPAGESLYNSDRNLVTPANTKTEDEISGEIATGSCGMIARPVRADALDAARGSTDFGQLFLGMSFFLILAAAGLAAVLMRLQAERRAAEAGMMRACGLTERQVSLVVRGEGFVLTCVGVLVGMPLGVLYAWAVLYALSTWWAGAVGTASIWLHLDWLSPLLGVLAGFTIGHFALGWGVRQLAREPLLHLLAGWQAMGIRPNPRGRRIAGGLLAVSLGGAVLMWLLSLRPGSGSGEESFFGIGAAVLCAGLCAAYLCLAPPTGTPNPPTRWRLALRALAANRQRSLLVVGLLAAATFILVTVAAETRDYGRLDVHNRQSGTGGFALQAESALPLHVDFSTPAGRKNLGFSPEDEQLFTGVQIIPFLLSPGDDISCLNLARPRAPRVLGVSEPMIARGGFTAVQGANPKANPWEYLRDAAPAHQPIVLCGDADSVRWTLHADVGEKYALTAGENTVDGRFACLFPGSIFGGEVLVSAADFKALYPDITQPRYFLIDTPPGREDAVAATLRRNLGEMGLQVRGTRELLNAYLGVQNTYLSTFLALGGLGLLLGTLGLVTVLLRNALERRREFALQLAIGFRRAELAAQLVRENAALLLAGLLLGTLSALVATAPQLRAADAHVNWLALAAVLAVTLATGLLTCLFAARAAVSGNIVAGLRGE